jgi:signal transduction histidine kinase
MLLVLHAALDVGIGSPLSAALMTAHLGLFFLWQPIWQKDQRLQLSTIALITLLVIAMVATLNWWSIFAWLCLLIGIVAGRSFSTRHERSVYMISLAFLVAELLVNCAAMVFFGKPLDAGIGHTFRIGLYLLPLLLYAIPSIDIPQRDPFAIDFFRGIAFALMTALMAVFSVVMTFRLNISYPFALVATLMGLGLFLLFLAWISTPGSGTVGLLAVWEKSVLNIGSPFETWLGNLANLAARSTHADDFLEIAIQELNDIPWISGVEWETENTRGLEGQPSIHHLAVDTRALKLTLYTERSFSSALLIHCRLLLQVLGHFYVAKRRENEEANEAHLRAVYETGARVTHDIKNLLQTLHTLASSLQRATTAEQEQRGYALIKRQLPDIGRRLLLALDKLQRPDVFAAQAIDAATWWARFHKRFADSGAVLDASFAGTPVAIPEECFDSVIENLLDNAIQKVAAGAASQVSVTFQCADGAAQATVNDNGAAIDAELVRRLFRGPVASDTGLGIGLYQAARQAQLCGYELVLSENRAGAVTFTLKRDPAAEAESERDDATRS